MGPAHVRSLDGVRGIAILLVLVHHLSTSMSGPWRALAYGWAGVPLFFTLSGFLITRILLASKDSPGRFRRFYTRRALRIFPLYYAVLAVTVAVSARPEHTSWLWMYGSNLPAAFPGLHGPEGLRLSLAHTWSLAIEEQFYLVWPAIVFAVSLRSLERVAIGCVAVAILSRVAMNSFSSGPGAEYFTLSHVDALGLGALLAVYEARGRVESPLFGWLAVASLPIMALAVSWRWWHHGEQDLVLKRTAVAFMSVAAIQRAVVAPSAWLSSPALRSSGKYSYAIYLLHMLPGDAVLRAATVLGGEMHSQTLANVVCLVGGVGVSWLSGWASWHGFEVHFARLKDRLGDTRALSSASASRRA